MTVKPTFPRDEPVWFGASSRTIGGLPDSRYGWLQRDDGPWIVKAMSPELVAYNQTLLGHERRMLRRLLQLGAPCPEMLEFGRDDWMVTRFGGLSLQRLEHVAPLQGVACAARLTAEERLATWIHLLRRLQPLADRGVLVIDLYGGNVVVPLTGATSGQLRLQEAMLIDHAHTLEGGMAMRRPVWMNNAMERIAPELRTVMRADQDALIAAFAAEGASLPGDLLPRGGDQETLSRRAWARYDAPQCLQRLLDTGEMNCSHAMQFAAAKSISRLLAARPERTWHAELERVIRRMTAADPARRYPTLTEAAGALAALLPAVPLVSRHAFDTLKPSDLAARSGPQAAITAEASCGTFGPTQPMSRRVAAPGATAFASARVAKPARHRVGGPMRHRSYAWLYAAVAAGVAIGTALHVPF